MNSFLKINILLTFTALLIIAGGCKKFLEKKSNAALVIPVTIGDLQALMDNTGNFNGSGSVPGMELSSDDFYLTDDDLTALYEESDRRLYGWEPNYVFSMNGGTNDWESCYSAVYTCNTVLEAVEKSGSPSAEWKYLKGQALLMRGARFLDAFAEWASAYDANTADQDLGIVLRKTIDFNELSKRASARQSYAQVISDLQSSVSLLPDKPLSHVRASRPAAFGMLARAYLYMRDYNKAKVYADSCLGLFNKLIDYNNLDPNDPYPLKILNEETILYKGSALGEPLFSSIAKIEPALINAYEDYDLRKKIFFQDNGNGSFGFKGYYTGAPSLFTGLATDEILLIRAECLARENKLIAAMADLNILLKNRFETGKFIPLIATNKQYALELILSERRKELLMRTLRWMDIKRLNKEGAGITARRTINGATRQLIPNDLRYALPIPEDVIARSGMQQNPR